MPATETELFDAFKRLDIAVRTVRHDPVHTVDQAKRVRGSLPGGHAKTLLLKDKKGRMALAVVHEDRRVDLKALATALDMGRLSFASAERLDRVLGVAPGSVTPFALINCRPDDIDPPLKVVLDRSLMAHDPLNFHPLHNAATTAIGRDDLMRFVRHCGFEPAVIDLDEPDHA